MSVTTVSVFPPASPPAASLERVHMWTPMFHEGAVATEEKCPLLPIVPSNFTEAQFYKNLATGQIWSFVMSSLTLSPRWRRN